MGNETLLADKMNTLNRMTLLRIKELHKDMEYRYYIESFGCQMNSHDSERIAGMLEEAGYIKAAVKEEADIILFNTCCVREHAELRVFGNVGALRELKEKKPTLIIGVCGCMTQQEEVAKLRENADELEVKSSVSGTIASISASAGKSIGGEDQPLATINVTDRGFTVKIDVTNEQAKKVKVGDTAELVNFWGGDAVATLDQITNSQSSGSRTLVFTLTGDIQAGQNVTLSIGQKSSNYDALIPLSGLREDSNGKFVYVLQSKNSPLGSRYIATRVTVQELARDDKSAAVSGISSGDFIITTSNKPVEAGKQVRLADNG